MDPRLQTLRLYQLTSPAFPVGAYSYSQGLEFACDEGVITDAASAEAWIADSLQHSVALLEAPLAARMLHCAFDGEVAALAEWNALYVSLRETAELRAEALQMGYSFKRIARDLGAWAEHAELPDEAALTYPCAFAWSCAQWRIAPDAALEAYLWAWCENQVMAAIKAVPLGQTAGQQMLARLASRLPAVADAARALADDDICNFTPGLAIASARHEAQYSRLFRS
jgi:urease accessory protein